MKNVRVCGRDYMGAGYVHLPNGLGRYMPEDAVDGLNGVSGSQLAGYRPPAKFEWYLKNHLGSTMLVYGTSAYNDPFNSGYKGGVKAAYDYRAFGEQVDLTEPTDKVTENFTGKEKDDETELNYFGARYLDPMLGMWTSVDPARQFSSPYLYAGNGVNPVKGKDADGGYYKDELGNRTYGAHVSSVNQGTIPSQNLRLIQNSINKFESNPNNEKALMSMAKYTYYNNRETRFTYGEYGPNPNSFGKGSFDQVAPIHFSGEDYVHIHSFRTVDMLSKAGLSDIDLYSSDGEEGSKIRYDIKALELRSGNMYYHSPDFVPDPEHMINGGVQYDIMHFDTWNTENYQNYEDYHGSWK